MVQQNKLFEDDNLGLNTKQPYIKLQRDLQNAKQFLDDIKVHYTRQQIKKMLFENLRNYYISKSLLQKINGEIKEWNTSDAGVYSMSIDDIPEEVVEVVYHVLNVVDNMELKSLRLYYGAFKEPLLVLYNKYPQYRIREFFKELEANSLLELYSVALKRLKAGYDGNKSLYQVTKSIREISDMLETNEKRDQPQIANGTSSGIVLNLNVNGGK